MFEFVSSFSSISSIKVIDILAAELKSRPSTSITNSLVVIAVVAIAIGIIVFPTVLTYKDNNFVTISKAFAQKSHTQNNTQQSANKITLQLNSIKFTPSSSNSNSNLLNALVDYQTNDASSLNTPMSGIMKVYLSNGTQIRTSSIPNGYVVEKAGTIPFSTSFTDNTIKNVKVTIYLTDPLKHSEISNEVTTKTSLSR